MAGSRPMKNIMQKKDNGQSGKARPGGYTKRGK